MQPHRLAAKTPIARPIAKDSSSLFGRETGSETPRHRHRRGIPASIVLKRRDRAGSRSLPCRNRRYDCASQQRRCIAHDANAPSSIRWRLSRRPKIRLQTWLRVVSPARLVGLCKTPAIKAHRLRFRRSAKTPLFARFDSANRYEMEPLAGRKRSWRESSGQQRKKEMCVAS